MKLYEPRWRWLAILTAASLLAAGCDGNGGPRTDTDGDGIRDTRDPDDDNDGVADAMDAFPLDAAESVDTDNDGIGNNADPDDDNDMVADVDDAFPLDASESADFDADGVGDNADMDDDNDNVADVNDDFPFNPARTMPIQPVFPQMNGQFQLPDWPSTRQLNWVLEQLAAPSTSIADIEARFLPSTLAVVPAADWQALLDTMRGVAPNGEIVDLIIVSPTLMQVHVGDASDPASLGLFITLRTRVANGGLIINLTSPSIPINASSVGPLNAGQTLAEAADRIVELADNASVLVASIDDSNVCTPLLDIDATVPRPLGQGLQSLWSLGALAQAVDDGMISATQQVMLDINNISTLGPFGFEPAGTTFSLTDLANDAVLAEPTAMDQLLDTVGRGAVEAALTTFGHQTPDLMTPFLKSNDYFNLTRRVPEADALTFVNGSEQEQRTFLDATLTPLGPYNLTVAPPFLNDAVHVSGLMQASAMDVCGALARLRQFNDQSEAFSIVNQALSGQSGGLKVRDRWERVWSAFATTFSVTMPIQLATNYAWLIETDGRGAFVVVAMQNNADDSTTNVPFLVGFSPLNRILEVLDETN